MAKVLHDNPSASSGSLVHSLNESVLPQLAIFGCVQSEVLLASNSSEPGRPSRATSYVPVRGATTVIANEPADLKKTSSVGSTPKDEPSWMSAKGARATTSHGGGGWLGGSGGDGGGDGGGGKGGGGEGAGTRSVVVVGAPPQSVTKLSPSFAFFIDCESVKSI